MQAAEREIDVERQMQIIENLIETRVAVLCICPSGSKEIVPAVGKANRAGIPVIIVDDEIDERAAAEQGVSFDTYIGSDNVEGGRIAGRYLVDASGGSARLALLEGIPGHQTGDARLRGFLDAIRSAPGIAVVASQTANWERDQGFTVFRNMLQAHPEIDALFACNDMMALGAVEAIQAAGRTGRIRVIGFDAVDDARKAIAAGRMEASVAQYPEEMGRIAIESAVKRDPRRAGAARSAHQSRARHPSERRRSALTSARAIHSIQRASATASSTPGSAGPPESTVSRKWYSSSRNASSYDTVCCSTTSDAPSMRSTSSAVRRVPEVRRREHQRHAAIVGDAAHALLVVRQPRHGNPRHRHPEVAGKTRQRRLRHAAAPDVRRQHFFRLADQAADEVDVVNEAGEQDNGRDAQVLRRGGTERALQRGANRFRRGLANRQRVELRLAQSSRCRGEAAAHDAAGTGPRRDGEPSPRSAADPRDCAPDRARAGTPESNRL